MARAGAAFGKHEFLVDIADLSGREPPNEFWKRRFALERQRVVGNCHRGVS
jgi:hypothetical protein